MKHLFLIFTMAVTAVMSNKQVTDSGQCRRFTAERCQEPMVCSSSSAAKERSALNYCNGNQCCDNGHLCPNGDDTYAQYCPMKRRDPAKSGKCPQQARWEGDLLGVVRYSCNAMNVYDLKQQPTCSCAMPGCQSILPQWNWAIGLCANNVDRNSHICYDLARKNRVNGKLASNVLLNYVAAYQLNLNRGQWQLLPSASENYDKSCQQPLDVLNDAESWLRVQPGGEFGFDYGLYTPDSTGVSFPGMLFVLSAQRFQNASWSILNQSILRRGPARANPKCQREEMLTDCRRDPTAGTRFAVLSPLSEDSHYFSTGVISSPGPSCLPINKGGASNPMYPSKPIFESDSSPHLYAAVIDQDGLTVYQDPVWDGLRLTDADENLASLFPKDAKKMHKLRFIPDEGEQAGNSCAENLWDLFRSTEQLRKIDY
jgi:hypothetical protein